jgi:hypothetical protein
MQEKHIRRIKIRRGSDNQRKLVIFEDGEPVYILDKKRIYIGDNTTYGGIMVSSRNFITASSDTRPPESSIGDLIYDKINESASIVDNDDSLNLNNTASIFCCKKIESEIRDIDALISALSAKYILAS